MKIWILIVLMQGPSGGNGFSQEFIGERACQFAAQKVLYYDQPGGTTVRRREVLNVMCVPKEIQ